MACNCTTKEQLEELYEKYGHKVASDRGQDTISKIKNGISILCVGLCMIVIVPFLFFYVFGVGLFSKEKKISFKKFFHLNKSNEELRQVFDSTMISTIKEDAQ